MPIETETARPVVRGPEDFWAGILLTSLGMGFALVALTYEQGSATRMGAGFFPLMLAVALILIGLAAVVRSLLVAGPRITDPAVRSMVLVLGATVVFGVLLQGAGLVVTVFVAVLVSARASARFRWRDAILLACGVTAVSVPLFATALGLPVPVLGPWLAG